MTKHAVIYAAKSTEDKHGSIPTQLEDCRRRAEREGWVVLDSFTDESFSAYSGNRGPGLERAKATAAAAAAGHGSCVLVAQDADRFARGAGDAPGAADHLGEVYFALKRQGVSLWTDRSGELDLLRAALEGERSHGESARKTQAVKAGKRRQAERGERLGGPIPLGYVQDGPKRVALDPATSPLVRRIFDLASRGVPDATVARTLNAEGHRTRKGQPFTRRLVQAMVCNIFYSGRIAYQSEVFEGQHEGVIDAARFDYIQTQRAGRDKGAGRHARGRNARMHLLARLATCGACGAPMGSYTSPYRRKSDGRKRRQYRCRGYHQADGTCSMTVDAETVDTGVMRSLAVLVPDFDQWIAAIEDRHADERDRLQRLVDHAEEERHALADEVEKHKKRVRRAVIAEDDAKERQASDLLDDASTELLDAEKRTSAAIAALDSVPLEAPRDRLLDFAIDLRNAISGKTADARSVEEVNRLLAEHFDRFVVIPPGSALPDGAIAHDSVAVEPVLRPEVVERVMAGNPFDNIGTPPMRWVQAVWPIESLTTPRRSDG